MALHADVIDQPLGVENVDDLNVLVQGAVGVVQDVVLVQAQFGIGTILPRLLIRPNDPFPVRVAAELVLVAGCIVYGLVDDIDEIDAFFVLSALTVDG
jgi:hypothetical protein